MQNALPLNPAFAGSRGAMSVAASYRNQWTGLNGAPSTQTLSLHAPTRSEAIAVGGSIYHDQIGVTDRTGINATGAYIMRLGAGKLAMGLSGGVVIGKNSWSEVVTTDESDEVFDTGDDSYLLPDFGTGVYYYTKNYYVSLSLPSLLSHRYAGGNGYNTIFDPQDVNLFLNVGGEFRLNSNVAVRPSAMLRMHGDNSAQIDINSMVSIQELIELGASYRTSGTMIGLLRVHLNPQFALGYAFDYTISDLRLYAGGTHEVTLQYDFKYKTNAFNPRFF